MRGSLPAIRSAAEFTEPGMPVIVPLLPHAQRRPSLRERLSDPVSAPALRRSVLPPTTRMWRTPSVCLVDLQSPGPYGTCVTVERGDHGRCDWMMAGRYIWTQIDRGDDPTVWTLGDQ